MSGDPVTVEDRFFLKIALKNGLLKPEDAQRASDHARRMDLSLEAALFQLRLLGDAQVRQVREAMAASQVIRLDSVYAEVAMAHGVPKADLQRAFEEQRQRRFRVRVGNVLLERGRITSTTHKAIVQKAIQRLEERGDLTYGGSSAAAPPLPPVPSSAQLPPLPQTPPSDLGSLPDAPAPLPRPTPSSRLERAPSSRLGAQPVSPQPVPAQPTQERPVIDLDDSQDDMDGASWGSGEDDLRRSMPEWAVRSVDDPEARMGVTQEQPAPPPSSRPSSRLPSSRPTSERATSERATGFLESNLDSLTGDLPDLSDLRDLGGKRNSGPVISLDSGERTGAREGQLVASAIRIGLSTDEGVFLASGSGDAEDDLFGSDGDFVMDRKELSATSEAPTLSQISPRVLQWSAAAVFVALIGIGLFVWVGAQARQQAVEEVRDLVARAGVADAPETSQQLYLQARERLSAVGESVIAPEVREELLGTIRWGGLRAEAEVELEAGRPGRAHQLLLHREAEVPASARSDYEDLLARSARRDAMERAESAQASQDWTAAVVALQEAQRHGDPGGAIGAQLQQIRAQLERALEASYEQALASLQPEDEHAFATQAKRIHDLFPDDPRQARADAQLRERLEELEYRRSMARGREAFGRDAIDAALAAFERAERLRPNDPEIGDWYRRIQTRREQTQHTQQALTAEHIEDYEAAAEAYTRARNLAQDPEERRRLGEAAERCRALHAQAERFAEVRRLQGEVVRAVRSSEYAEALALLDALEDAQPDARAGALIERLRAFLARLEGTICVPGGEFLMGVQPDVARESLEAPQRRLDVPTFFMSRCEITNEEYAAYVEATGARPPAEWRGSSPPRGQGRHPVVGVSWDDARAYAEWRGARLPTEAQWEKAARGVDGRTYPWGEEDDPEELRAHVATPPAGTSRFPTAEVGTHADDVSPYGVFDLGGNVNEWTADLLRPYPGAPADVRVPAETRRVIRGGDYLAPVRDARCTRRDGAREDYTSEVVGFRVVIEPPAELVSVFR